MRLSLPRRPVREAPAPVVVQIPEWTVETQLILTTSIIVAIMAVYSCSGHCWGVNGRSSQTHLIVFAAVSSTVGILVGPADSVGAMLRVASLLPLPPAAIPFIGILLGALIVAFRFTAVVLGEADSGAVLAATSPGGSSALELIRSRRSIFPKDLSGMPVPRHLLARGLEAANWAPTHGKTEPWRFVVFAGAAGLRAFHSLKRAATERHLAANPDALAAALAKIDKKRPELDKVP